MARPTEDQVWEQIEAAQQHIDEGMVAWPGMSYEQGVANGLRWALGEDDMPPMEEEE